MALAYYVLLLAILAVSLILALIPWRPPALRAAMAAAHLVVTVIIVVLYLRAPYGAGPWLVVFAPGAVASVVRLVRFAVRAERGV